jgi:hypothetical protein
MNNLRGTGRTTRMLERAIEQAAKPEQKILIFCATYTQCGWMIRRFCELLDKSIISFGRVEKYKLQLGNKTEVRFAISPDLASTFRDSEWDRIFRGVEYDAVYEDHYVGELLREKYRRNYE